MRVMSRTRFEEIPGHVSRLMLVISRQVDAVVGGALRRAARHAIRVVSSWHFFSGVSRAQPETAFPGCARHSVNRVKNQAKASRTPSERL